MAKRKKQHKSKNSSIIFKAFFILGISLIAFSVYLKVDSYRSLSFASSVPAANVDLKTSNPTRIIIPSVNIDLPIEETLIHKNNWEIYENGASHLNTSANPGEGGNVIIYAHNTRDRFGSLEEVKKGEIIKLYSEDHKVYTYEVVNILVVNPTQVELLAPTKSELITIYTCIGFADLKRLVIQAEIRSL